MIYLGQTYRHIPSGIEGKATYHTRHIEDGVEKTYTTLSCESEGIALSAHDEDIELIYVPTEK